MNILSVYPYTHLSSSALVIDGRVVAAAAEERFNREKMSTKFPAISAQWCLDSQGISWKDIDIIAVPWNPQRNINHASKRWVAEMAWRGEMLTHIPVQIMRAMNEPVSAHMEVSFGKTRIVYLNHHECHAANAFFLSPFDKADILTIDGHGEDESCFFGNGKDTYINQTGNVLYPHSLGLFYGTFTDFLGFTPEVDEWKVMALSAFAGKKNEYYSKIRSLIHFTDEGFELDLSYFDFYTFDRRPHFFNPKITSIIGQPRQRGTDFEDRHYAIAGAMQRVFSEAVIHLLTLLNRRNRGKRVVLAGGAAMNSLFNGTIDSLDIYQDSFIPPSPDDSGVSVGAALLAYYRFGKEPARAKYLLKENSWGPSYTEDQIENTLIKFKLSYSRPVSLVKQIAGEIAKGALVGWFQGGMEFGHRALGNRSILADPRDVATKDCVNSAVKYRESFRPFAPAVLAERAEEIFELRPGRRVYFMERVFPIRKKWRSRLGAVCHVDFTGRLQTVEPEANKLLYNLIKEFDNITGVPALLNTSFNLNGEPIVCSPEHAIRTFYSCGLDILVLGPFVIKKR